MDDQSCPNKSPVLPLDSQLEEETVEKDEEYPSVIAATSSSEQVNQASGISEEDDEFKQIMSLAYEVARSPAVQEEADQDENPHDITATSPAIEIENSEGAESGRQEGLIKKAYGKAATGGSNEENVDDSEEQSPQSPEKGAERENIHDFGLGGFGKTNLEFHSPAMLMEIALGFGREVTMANKRIMFSTGRVTECCKIRVKAGKPKRTLDEEEDGEDEGAKESPKKKKKPQ